MSVSSLIRKHHVISEQLVVAIENDDEDTVLAADQSLSVNLQEILKVEPTDGPSKAMLLDFLLSILKPETERSSLDQQVCERLRSICTFSPGVITDTD